MLEILAEKGEIDERVAELEGAREAVDELAREVEEGVVEKLFAMVKEGGVDEELLEATEAFIGLLCNLDQPTHAEILLYLSSHDALVHKMLTTSMLSLSPAIVEKHTATMDDGLADKFHDDEYKFNEFSAMTEWTRNFGRISEFYLDQKRVTMASEEQMKKVDELARQFLDATKN